MGIREWQDEREDFMDEMYESLNKQANKSTHPLSEEDMEDPEPEPPKQMSRQDFLTMHHAAQISNETLSDDDITTITKNPPTFTDAMALQEVEDANDRRDEILARLMKEKKEQTR